MISYQYDGQNFVINTRGDSQKAKNLSRRPEVTLAIVDGGQQLIVYGRAQIVRDTEQVARLNLEWLNLGREHPWTDDAELRARIEREGRVALIVTPERYFPIA
jgi:nitroimidazol reductase NimA-like FMN-containing flavoprotein (pyridoxamine 5'-phosphate oxidase superfamily)